MSPRPRAVSALFAVLVGGALLVLPAAAASARPATASTSGPPAVTALDATGLPTVRTGVDDFTFDSFDAQYTLGRDASKRSTLHTTEKLVAEFPSYDQNRGIVRAIPGDYDAHPTQIHLLSVTDGSGHARSYETSYDNGFFTVTIAVPKGQYVHGAQTYVIDYTQEDVTRHFTDTADDEFYWDVNGTGWAQPFAEVSAKVILAPGLAPRLNGKTACYHGLQGSAQPCTITNVDSVFSATVTKLAPSENMTVAIGFSSGTFAAASSNPLSYVPVTGLAGAVLAVLTLLFGLIAPLRGRAKGTGIVIAQYQPPAGVSAIVAANIVGQTGRGFAASIVDLAVRGNLKLHVRKSGLFGTSEQFGVQPLHNRGLDDDEGLIFTAISAGPQEGGVVWLQKNDTTLGAFVQSITRSVAAETIERGLRRTPPRGRFWIALLLSIAGAGLMALTIVNATNDVATVFGIVGVVVAIFFAIVALGRTGGARPLTENGKLLDEHLEGLKLYIRFAEADRLRMLQSVTGAERIDTSDAGQIVKIYEKLLPYATLFGLEEQWARELGKFYDHTPPDWYDGGNVGAFSAGYFAGSIGAFGSSVASSYSGSASSSSSGGSGGGGFSGGGGGGGGGGGI